MKPPGVSAPQLEYLVAAVEHDTWKDAAGACGVSPSAFSQGIAELERRLGVTLFERDGRRRVPTLDAAAAVDHARRVLAEMRALARWADETRGGASGVVRAGMIDTAAVHHFGDTLVRYRRQRPGVAVQLTVQPSGELHELLAAGEVDVIVAVDTDTDTAAERLERAPLVDEPLYVYAPPGRATSDRTSWGPWVGFPAASRTRALVARTLRASGVPYEVIAETSQPAVLREMVQLGMGWTVLSAVDAEREPHALVRAVPDAIAVRTLSLARRIDRVPSAAVTDFVDHIVAAARTEA